ncbi:hypothetical protein BT96DRAFT_1008279 [Gymnopus androsaceus JB14]|uniref:Uncharacterized protein n=1 Tax=Gymnopus androsaceus JB14 TaxID=1447944 RepID=A0A6A4GF81_9AGAR|nr:hypothetical protein BT96DRAFT_1008279 [Gymnopus androsaceus JB14]
MSDGEAELKPHEAEISLSLTTYTLTMSKAKKPVTTLKKDTGPPKTKSIQFSFKADEDNYIILMNTLLATMGLDTLYKATDKKSFCMKIAAPLKKKTKACDVETLPEYIVQVEKIIENETSKPIVVLIDGKDISETCLKGKKATPLVKVQDDGQMNTMDKELAHIRILLEKEHGNDYNMSYTGLNPATAKKVPLSPAAMDEWVRAICSGLADKNPPSDPDSPHFGVANHQSAIQPFAPCPSTYSCHHPSMPATTTTDGKSDLAHLATIMSMIGGRSASPLSSKLPAPPSSPVKNTPMKLCCFLEYAETDVGIKDANLHYYALDMQGYGPDILDCVENKELVDLGIKAGDVIHLKQAAPVWFGSSNAKRQQTGPSTSIHSAAPDLFPNCRYFGKQYHDGGRYEVRIHKQ